jgi:hypothetical protein
MRCIASLLVVAAVGVEGFEPPSFLTEFAAKANDKLMHLGPYMRQIVKETVNKHEFPLLMTSEPKTLHKLVPANGTDDCKTCLEGASKFIIEHSLQQLKAMCEKADGKSCKATKICHFLGNHPKITIGMMIEHVRPMALSMAYCAGKGVCKPDAQIQAEVFQGKEAHEALMDHYDNLDLDGVTDEVGELAPESSDDEEEVSEPEEQCEDEHHHHDVCPYCLKRAIRHIMGHAVMKVHEMCHATTCPKAQRMCQWARDNKEVAFGMLLMKVEPWKGAFGFCVGFKKGKGKGKGKHHGKGKGKGWGNGDGEGHDHGKGKGWHGHHKQSRSPARDAFDDFVRAGQSAVVV